MSIAATLTLLLAIAAPRPPVADSPLDRPASLRMRGLEHGYNLDYSEALAAFQQAIDIDPDDGTAHRLAAATIWMQLLFEQGAVTSSSTCGRTMARCRLSTTSAAAM